MTDLTSILNAAVSSNNDVRKQGEETLNNLSQQPNVFLPQILLFANASTNHPDNLRMVALTLFNNNLTRIKI
ncbi:hypothetical protein QTN25_002610 [Entamoeba marina]